VGQWLKQRDAGFEAFVPIGDKDTATSLALFENYSRGVATSRDAWCFNYSSSKVTENITRMAAFYNQELVRFGDGHGNDEKTKRAAILDSFVNNDPSLISWNRSLKQDLLKGKSHQFEPRCLTISLYRPYTKQWLYFSRQLNDMVYQMPRIFPDSTAENRLIMIKQRWSGQGQLALMVNRIPDLQSDGGSQCFPLFLYDEAAQTSEDDLFAEQAESGLRRREAITDAGLAHFHTAYPGEQISKEDLFYYVYGVLHSPDYRERFADNLSKELPRIPAVKKAADFWAFSKAGRALADLHLNYETVELYPLTIETKGTLTNGDYRVEKMKFAKKGDKTTVIYNHRITLKGIPEAAWDYVINGKAALDWVMERQAVRTDKASGIVNDANDWAVETMGNPKYPLELFQRVVTVSLETQKIVKALPILDIATDK